MKYVKDIMSTDLIILNPMDSLKMAREVMEKDRIRHIPIVSSQGKFLGLLTQRDVLKSSVSHFADIKSGERDEIESGIPIAECMSTDVFTVSEDFPLAKAAHLLLAHKFGCLPVLADGWLAGILTESDFVKLCLRYLEQEDN